MKTCKRVVLFGVDGAGTYFEQAKTPNIDRIFCGGSVCRRTLTEIPSISAECWGSMLHGVSCEQHGLTNWTASNLPYPSDSPYPSVFKAIREACPDAVLASFSDWPAINDGIIEQDIGVYKQSALDFYLIDQAVDYIEENDFTFLFIQFDSVDRMGHRHGYGSQTHLDLITLTDTYIGRMVRTLEKQNRLEDTLLIVEADHGGTRARYSALLGNHGGDSDEEKYVLFAAVGGGVCPGEITGMMVRDTAAVILHALGIPQPASWSACVPNGLFNDAPMTVRRQETAEKAITASEADCAERGEFLKRFAAMEPMIYLPFDDEAEGRMEALESYGKLYRIEGRKGKGLRMDDGCISLGCPDLHKGFTMMAWMKLNHGEARAEVMKVCSEKGEQSLLLHLASYGNFPQYIILKILDRSNLEPVSILIPRPKEIIGRWTHICVSFDPARRTLIFWMDFREVFRWNIEKEREFPLEGGTLHIGGEPGLESGKYLPAVLDDVCILSKPIGHAEIETFRTYYGV
ncbi:MAG: alkaline phosphatase family protein [Clostridia bacterium]|nr:alkaline phosphatase family protein [Clostridia bacterium]